MISTDDRSPSGGDNSTTRLNHFNNNNNTGENSLYYQYVPSPPAVTPVLSPTPVTTPPSSPLFRRHSHQHHYQHNPHAHFQSNQIALIDSQNSVVPVAPGALVHSNSSPSVQTTNGIGITDFIHHHLSSRLIPKLGSIVKRFSLNYSGEGLVTDRQLTRTVRVGIRFQVQVDSFVNNRQRDNSNPRAILRTQSAPAVEQLDSGFSSPTADIFSQNNRQLALEYNNTNCSSTDSRNTKFFNSNSCPISSATSTSSVEEDCHCSGEHSATSSTASSGAGIIVGDISSGVSSEASSPTCNRKQPSSATLAFHNRINQALNLYRNQLATSSSAAALTDSSATSDEPILSRRRRSSVQVYRQGNTTPERLDSSSEQLSHTMEDSSSYQVLRHFPGSNVNSLDELSWETAAFEKQIRDRIQWIGDKVSSIRIPRIIRQLMDFGREYARENPVTALVLLALCLTSSAPVLMFLVFAVATILVTFLGFLFVEGTLLTVATVIFGGVILVVGFITLTAVLIGMLGYFTTNQAYLVLTGRSKVFKLLRKLPLIGRFFPDVKDSEIIVRQHLSTYEETRATIPNGNATNGYGSHHRQPPNATEKNHFYMVDDDDDDMVNDILDSEEEFDDITTEADNAVVSSSSSPGDFTIVDDQGNHVDNKQVLEDDEDLGNQEIISNAGEGEVAKEQTNKSDLKEENVEPEEEGKIQFVDCAKMNGTPVENGDHEAESVKPPTPCIQLNGHHDEETDTDSEIPKNGDDVESLA